MLNTQKTLTGSDILVNIENVYKVNSRRAK